MGMQIQNSLANSLSNKQKTYLLKNKLSKKVASPEEKRQLADELKKLKSLIDSFPAAVCLFDSELNFTYINKSWLRRYGIKKEDRLGKNLLDVYPSIKNTERYAKYKEVIKTGKPFYTGPVPHPKHKDRYLNIKAFKVMDGLGMIATDVTERLHIEEELKKSDKLLRNLARNIHSVKEEEGIRIAREIHDELSQSLTVLKMDLSWIERKLTEEQKAQKSFQQKIEKMAELIDKTTIAVKKISATLRPELLDDLGLTAAMDWQIQEFENRTKVQCTFRPCHDSLDLTPDLSITIFRIFQEALTNVMRHSEATKLKISLKRNGDGDKLELKIKDNGRGITEEEICSLESFGLIGMKERLYPFKGKFKITGVPDKGTTLVVSLPLNHAKIKSDSSIRQGN